MKLNHEDVNIRVVDQRIGMGIGGWNTIIRIEHIPTGIIIEMPSRICRSPYYSRQAALDALEMALTHVDEGD